MTDSEFKALNQSRLADAPAPLTLWRHYKGGLYVVVCSSCLEDNPDQVVVTYRSCLHGSLFTRPLENWVSLVTVGTSVFPRFLPVASDAR